MPGNRFINLLDTNSDRDEVSHSKKSRQSNKRGSIYHSDSPNHPNKVQKQFVKVRQGFTKESYPLDFTQSNPFCPICGKYVAKNVSPMMYQSSQRRKQYLSHQSCISDNASRVLSVGQGAEARLQSIAFVNHIRSIALGGKQFYVELQILHPLGGFSFAKLWTKLKSTGSFINWDLRNVQESDSFNPNIIAFPLPDFQIAINLIEIGDKESKINKRAIINVGRLNGNQVQYIKATTNDLEVTMRIIGTKQQQLKTIDETNIKYRYPLDTGTPIVELVRVQVRLPATESDEQSNDEQSRSSRITELMSERTSQRGGEERSVNNSEALSQRSFDREKVDLQKLISSGNLAEYVRQNTQSRVFQGWLDEASSREVDEIISSLWDEMPELIIHEYANYMVQKMLGVCTLPQRLRILERMYSDIPGIARNKQGTHSLQTLIALFTTDEQYKQTCDSIRPTFLLLAQHPNATHFLQKIISNFPLTHTVSFMEIVNQDLISYALDKNAMCVIKQMIRRVSDLENSKREILAVDMRRQIIHSVNFNIDKIIGDPYGNYVLQFCYEHFGEEKCGAITDRIIDKFTQFSLQKYSSAVIFKCINTYWTNKETLMRLKNTLNSDAIIQMFRNRDANKILLEIMEKHEGSPLREKINNQLMQGELTKFNHQRWGVALGSRSGMVGYYKSFPEAVKKSPKKKKKYQNNNIH